MNRLLRLVCIATLLCLSTAAVSAIVQRPQGGKSTQHSNDDEAVKNQDGTVEVSFKIDNQGRVQIVSMNASNPQLADYVIKKLNKIKLSNSDAQSGKIIKYRFVFRKQA